MLKNLPSSENIALPTKRQSLVSNLQLVDESSTRHRVMPPSYCANNYDSSCQNVHRRNGPNLREHQELGEDLSSLDQGRKFTEAWIFRAPNEFVATAKPSYGIASLLLPGGRTAHSKFKIYMIVDEDTTCRISQNTPLADFISITCLVIWDEAPMEYRNVFETVNKIFKDIIGYTNPDAKRKVFGGKTIVLGGDFRQILPAVVRGGREDIVASSVNRSKDIWQDCKVLELTTNMRLHHSS
ncbi:UNVERIFIED_CONTAM: hypothetical protein Sradi_0479400 [Sesamum radiatum]|uniref:ATP-dependent DNA helicase n=1 Tax=Sesamum radiatum TaxID=300843 RepID=A0AAW2WC53_SESRA